MWRTVDCRLALFIGCNLVLFHTSLELELSHRPGLVVSTCVTEVYDYSVTIHGRKPANRPVHNHTPAALSALAARSLSYSFTRMPLHYHSPRSKKLFNFCCGKERVDRRWPVPVYYGLCCVVSLYTQHPPIMFLPARSPPFTGNISRHFVFM